MYKAFHIPPVTGYSHRLLEKSCQDSSDACIKEEEYVIASVSDGHGGELYFRSEYGSKFAVETSINVIKDFLENKKIDFLEILNNHNNKQIEETIKNINAQIISNWREKVLTHYRNNEQLSIKECEILNKINKKDSLIDPSDDFICTLYGATLIIAFMTKEFAIVSKIGDGECICLSGDKIYSPISKDEKLEFGLTTSLCDKNALENFKHKYFSSIELQEINGFILTTDGIVDSYSEEDLKKFSKKIMDEFCKDEENTKEQLREWLQELTKQGSHDDMTIAGIFKD